MEHITQPSYNTCMSTCIAMVTGEPVNEVVEMWHNKFQDQTAWLDDALRYYNVPFFIGSPRHYTHPYGFAYIIGVPSLNIEAGMHQCVLIAKSEDDITLLDPAKGREGKRYYIYPDARPAENEVHLSSWYTDIIIPLKQP